MAALPPSTQRPDADANHPVGLTGEIYTMPSRFIGASGRTVSPAGNQHSSGGSRRGLIIGIIVGVVVLLLVGGALILTKLTAPTNTTNGTTNAGQNANTISNLPITNVPLNTNAVNSTTNVPLTNSTNVNVPLNTNVPPTTNAVTNANVNAVTNTNATTNTSQQVVDSVDTDRDGVTDVEERLYGLVATEDDSDGDGFLDREELVNLFNPAGAGMLATSDVVMTYTNDTVGFTVLAPLEFLTQPTGLADNEVVISYTPSAEFFQVRAIDNPSKRTARQWYLDREPTASPSQVKDVTVGSLKGVQSPDGFTIVLADSTRIYTLNYDFGGQREINFRTTFEVLVRSFKTFTPKKTTNANTNSNTNTNTNANTNTANSAANS